MKQKKGNKKKMICIILAVIAALLLFIGWRFNKETWGCPVVFYTNARFGSQPYDAMVVRLHELKEKWELGVLDLWNAEELSNITEAQRSLYMKDDIHPIKAGYRDWWGPELERQLLEFLSK